MVLAERLVLSPYTSPEGVALRGYADGEEGVMEAVRLAVEITVEHMAAMAPEHLAAASRGERSESYRRVSMVPSAAFRLLDKFDTRQPLWRV